MPFDPDLDLALSVPLATLRAALGSPPAPVETRLAALEATARAVAVDNGPRDARLLTILDAADLAYLKEKAALLRDLDQADPALLKAVRIPHLHRRVAQPYLVAVTYARVSYPGPPARIRKDSTLTLLSTTPTGRMVPIPAGAHSFSLKLTTGTATPTSIYKYFPLNTVTPVAFT